MNITYNELANYNNGRLVYKTFDLDGVSKDEHYTELTEWLDSLPPVHGCKCEEWNVADVEDVPRDMVGDYGIDPEFFELMEFIDSSGFESEQVFAYMDWQSSWNATHFENSYCGYYGNDALFSDTPMATYARESFESGAEIPEHLANYIDWERVTSDFEIDHADIDGHIFRSC